MKLWLSQNNHSSAMTPSFQRPIVTIETLKDLFVGGIVLSSPAGIGLVNVPSMIPVTAVHSPEAILMGCSFMRVSGA